MAAAPKLIAPKVNKLLTAVAVLSFIALFVTAYLVYLHFEPAASEFCELGEGFSCDIVNKSPWSVLTIGSIEIPVAILGFVTYVILFLGSLGVLKKWKFQKIHSWLRSGNVIKLLSWLSYVGLLFSLYLTYIEAFKLKTYCIFCLAQQSIILVIAILFLVINSAIQKSKKESKVCEFC